MSEDTPGVDPYAVRAMESQSRDKLAVARHLHEQGNYDDAVSRAYYAVFHAATLLLYCAGLEFSSHAQLIGAFNREFIRTRLIDPTTGAAFRDLFELRQGADYDIYHAVDQEESNVAVDRAAKFVDTVISVGRTRYPEAFAHRD